MIVRIGDVEKVGGIDGQVGRAEELSRFVPARTDQRKPLLVRRAGGDGQGAGEEQQGADGSCQVGAYGAGHGSMVAMGDG